MRLWVLGFRVATLLLLALALHARAQYAITFSTMDSGGGRSTGSVYAVTGTAGQPDAATHSGGAYTLVGGFWGVMAAVQSEDAPLLRIVGYGEKVVIAWPNPSTGFQLQVSPSLSAPMWSDVNDPPDVVGSEKQVALAVEPGARFFRLRQP